MSFLHKLLHPCRRVDELLSQAMDEPLGWSDRLRLNMHLRMCGNCQHVEQQVDVLRQLSVSMGELDESSDLPVDPLPKQPPRRPGT
ncbi:zf-HC2 domain-containing protein [Hydrogenophaga sp.]|jgi:hypothetical protein|uniref:zf-HC2 domain-containing protein n=1 Tax=Hydrogenophaga sp. TaxID=1904254 RepID=UPI00262A9C25|nr:zf-HC2 domain-containing protein [Hydrogenophaga sp.]MDM7948927.1 zf-HC2 domain-containing protein [Hydrogenophaga sp.]